MLFIPVKEAEKIRRRMDKMAEKTFEQYVEEIDGAFNNKRKSWADFDLNRQMGERLKKHYENKFSIGFSVCPQNLVILIIIFS